MTVSPQRALALLYCYAPEDAQLYKELDRHLIALKEPGWIRYWYNQEVLAGAEWEREVTARLDAANVILLLISIDFLASELCAMEMKKALAKHERGEALVIPILVRPVDLEGTALQQLHILPEGGKTVTDEPAHDGVWQQVARSIRRAIEVMFPEIFVIATPAEKPFAERLRRDMQRYGITLSGDDGEDTAKANEIHPALRRAAAVLLITSPNAPASRQFKHYFDQAKILRKSMIAIRADSEEDERIAAGELRENVLIDARGDHYEAALQAIVFQLRQEEQKRSITATSPLAPEPRNPYKGLRAFTEEDTNDFFGREDLIKEMMETLTHLLAERPEDHHSSRLMAVIGASGSGKSSVVMAGLLPRLRRGMLPGSEQWVYLERLVPGEHPLEALALALARIVPNRDALAIQSALEGDSTRILHLLATETLHSQTAKLVLFIDQFEELFTLTTAEEERQHFIDLLVTAASDPHGPVLILLTLRADFFDRPMAYPLFSRLLQKHLVQVLPMDLNEVRAAIEQPTELADVQLQFESDLANELLFEMYEQTEALPLLGFTLEQLFQRRDGHLLTIQAYHDIGGLRGALAKQVAVTYAALPTEEHRRLARDLFLRLVNLTPEQKALRRRASLAELVSGNVQRDQRLNETIDAFVTDRLLSANYSNGVQTYEISHETLIYEWGQLVEWLKEAREDLLLQQNLDRDVAAWKERHQPKDRLYRGQQLREARAWARRNQPNPQEAVFLRSSTTWHRQRLASTLALVLLPLLIISSFLQLLAARPAWCPSFICLPPATNPLGSHDANLDVYFTGFQSNFYVIAGKQAPGLNSLPNNTNPQSIGAILLDDSTQPPYRIAIEVNRRYQGPNSIIIDRVTCLIRKVLPLPQPLYVLSSGQPTTYSTAFLYTVTYRLQPAGARIVAQSPPNSYQYLRKGENDQLDVQIISRMAAVIQFQIQITYHVAATSSQPPLTLPQTFEVVFSHRTNWHEVPLSVKINGAA